jgi:hypothetical protein
MEAKEPIHRTDDELKDTLDELGTWVIHGHGDRVFGVGGSLRRAISRAAGFAKSGAVVTTVARVPPNRIFVFHDQIVRLVEQTREHEYAEDP